VEAVLLVLPHHLHHPIGVDCLERGKHVLLEKPMAITEAECLDLIAVSERAKRTLMIAYCMRYHPVVARMKELIEHSTFGECFQVSIWTEQLTRALPGSWTADHRSLGGGQLLSHGCHYIDILLWYLGRPVSGTHAGTRLGTPWMDWEGTSNVTMEFEGRKLAYHFGTWGARGTRLGYTFHAHCTDGLLDAQISYGDVQSQQQGLSRLYFVHEGREELLLEAEASKQTENEMAHFLDCIASGATPLTDGPGSLQGLRAIWRLYDAEGRGVVADLRGLGLDQYTSEIQAPAPW
jgi:predicted dehydrogenase